MAPSARRERAEQLLHAIEAVGDWRLLCLLGMGGMSNVYLAQHSRQPGRSCAVKLTKDFVLDSSQPESDPCAAAVLLEWRTYQQIGRSSGAKRKLGSGQEAAAAAVKSGKAGKPGGAQPAPQPARFPAPLPGTLAHEGGSIGSWPAACRGGSTYAAVQSSIAGSNQH